MTNIDGVNYYKLREMLDLIERDAGINIKLNNTCRQFFYRLKLPKIAGKKGKNHLYREDGVIEVIQYFIRKNRIRQIKKILAELRHKNTTFIKKYKNCNNLFNPEYIEHNL